MPFLPSPLRNWWAKKDPRIDACNSEMQSSLSWENLEAVSNWQLCTVWENKLADLVKPIRTLERTYTTLELNKSDLIKGLFERFLGYRKLEIQRDRMADHHYLIVRLDEIYPPETETNGQQHNVWISEVTELISTHGRKAITARCTPVLLAATQNLAEIMHVTAEKGDILIIAGGFCTIEINTESLENEVAHVLNCDQSFRTTEIYRIPSSKRFKKPVHILELIEANPKRRNFYNFEYFAKNMGFMAHRSFINLFFNHSNSTRGFLRLGSEVISIPLTQGVNICSTTCRIIMDEIKNVEKTSKVFHTRMNSQPQKVGSVEWQGWTIPKAFQEFSNVIDMAKIIFVVAVMLVVGMFIIWQLGQNE